MRERWWYLILESSGRRVRIKAVSKNCAIDKVMDKYADYVR
jgi:hypothetical protein